MGPIRIMIDREGGPKNAAEVAKYLREMACVDPDTGYRRLPNYIDDEVFNAAALYIEMAEATTYDIDHAVALERERCRVACIDQAGRHAAYASGKSEADACRACAKVITGADPYETFKEKFG